MPKMNNETIDKSQSLKSVRLIKVDGTQNNNKYWCCWLMPDGKLYAEFGRLRVGGKPNTYVYNTQSVPEAEAKLSSLIKSKLKDNYTYASVEEDAEEPINWSVLGENALIIEQAIERLKEIEQQVKPHAQVKFDSVKGAFVTHLGKISLTTIEKARRALSYVEGNLRSPHKRDFVTAAEDYLKIIQIPTGMKLDVQQLLGSTAKIRKQREVLVLLSEGLELIASTRKEILELALTLKADDRSAWMHWGEVDTTDEGELKSFEDERSKYISWS
jgi:predicted DNA-binding WGR domain protein